MEIKIIKTFLAEDYFNDQLLRKLSDNNADINPITVVEPEKILDLKLKKRSINDDSRKIFKRNF